MASSESSDGDTEARHSDTIFTLAPLNEPVPIYLHNSLSQGAKRAIRAKITAGGGVLVTEEDDAEVIICREDHPAFQKLVHKFEHFRYVWVEPPAWVEDCVRRQRYDHFQPVGRTTTSKSKRARVDFTPEDDKHLAEYLALRIPFKDAGGRFGFNVYKELVHPERAQLYPWAKRHPWTSWRERYKKHQDIFDSAIRRIVNSDPDPPVRGGKGQYVLWAKKQTINHLRHTVEDEEDELDNSSEREQDEARERESTPKLIPGRRRTLPLEFNESEEEPYPQNHDAHLESPSPPFRAGSSDVEGVPQPEDNTQRSLPAGSGVRDSPHAAPPNTQVTLVHASPPHARRRESPKIYPNTRSRTRNHSIPEQIAGSSQPPKRSRGRPKKKRRPSGSSEPAGESSLRPESAAPSGTSAGNGARVEAMLTAEGGGDGDGSMSFEDDIEQELIAGQQKMLAMPLKTRSSKKGRAGSTSTNNEAEKELFGRHQKASKTQSSKKRRLRGSQPMRSPPSVDLQARARIASSARDAMTLRPAALNNIQESPDDDPNAASNTKASPHAAVSYRESDVAEQSEATTDSSFPAEHTDAWQFKTANKPFEPSPGTRAEAYLRSRAAKGKRKAR